MSAYVIIVYTDEPREVPILHAFPTDELAERFVVEDAADEWLHAYGDDDDEDAPAEPTTYAEAREVYENIGSTRKVHLLRDGVAYEHDDDGMVTL